ncbi:hypothetical protein M9H77_13391 [Catharanthus roseus]|uniref:Uncharacterized protein n=1 Tax=Catharanthus roseus TaxID=4058 RepID=A0ACC0BK08_CATRO|nr:hypothetical protein M9H77_13391 [Catharanthus roseus]
MEHNRVGDMEVRPVVKTSLATYLRRSSSIASMYLACEDVLDMINECCRVTPNCNKRKGWPHHLHGGCTTGPISTALLLKVEEEEIQAMWVEVQEEIILQGSDDITFEIDEAVAKHSVTIKHMIEDKLASRGPILLPKVLGNILAKVIVEIIYYCKRLVTQPFSFNNDVEIKAFVLELVNDDEHTLFGLLVTADYITLKGILSFVRVQVLYYIKHKDPTHIR